MNWHYIEHNPEWLSVYSTWLRWLEENVGVRNETWKWEEIAPPRSLRFGFTNPEDATAFKLRFKI